MVFLSSLEAVTVWDDLADDGEAVLGGELVGHAPTQREARRPVVVRRAQLILIGRHRWAVRFDRLKCTLVSMSACALVMFRFQACHIVP